MEQQNYGEIAIFNSEDGTAKVQIQAVVRDETVWLTQKAMSELFEVRIPTINEHLTHIFQDNELEEKRTIRKFRIVQTEGTRQVEREVSFYNLDAIIAVGYRVNSKRATQFRIWATSILKEYLVKGFALDDERFKKGQSLTHFRELLESCLLYTSPSPRDSLTSRMPSSA